jgi:hypothetical protein
MNLDALQSRANRAGSDLRSALHSIEELRAAPAFCIQQGMTAEQVEAKLRPV